MTAFAGAGGHLDAPGPLLQDMGRDQPCATGQCRRENSAPEQVGQRVGCREDLSLFDFIFPVLSQCLQTLPSTLSPIPVPL